MKLTSSSRHTARSIFSSTPAPQEYSPATYIAWIFMSGNPRPIIAFSIYSSVMLSFPPLRATAMLSIPSMIAKSYRALRIVLSIFFPHCFHGGVAMGIILLSF